MTIKLGYKASAEQFGPGDIVRFGCLADELGFDSVFISDHFQPWRHTGGHAPVVAGLTLGALGGPHVAGDPRHQRSDPNVPLPPFHCRPGNLRRSAAWRRGASSWASAPASRSMKSPHPARCGRNSRNDSAVSRRRLELDAAGALDRRASSGFRGVSSTYKTENATLYDRPEQPIPIFVAAHGAVMAKFVGRNADGFICTSGKPSTFYNETLLPNLAQGLSAAGRSSNAIARMIEMKVSFDPDKTRAREDTRFWAALALSQDEKISVEDPLEMEQAWRTCLADRAASLPAPDRVVERSAGTDRAYPAVCRRWVSTTWSSMLPATIRNDFSRSICCRSAAAVAKGLRAIGAEESR